jgi:putative Ca2+/H+ antiporter (TMEM165/GDT1 family)
VFVASASALTVSSLLAVVLGDQITRIVSPSFLETLAGIGFMVIGLWVLLAKYL